MCKLDDTWAEAAHRDVIGHAKRAPASRMANIAASQMLEQHLKMEDGLQGSALGHFHKAFRCWKAIVQRPAKAARARKLQPRRMKDSGADAHIYRFDGAARFSWRAALGSTQEGEPLLKSDVMHRMQEEWLRELVVVGAGLEFPFGQRRCHR